jgi:hypothetical protein
MALTWLSTDSLTRDFQAVPVAMSDSQSKDAHHSKAGDPGSPADVSLVGAVTSFNTLPTEDTSAFAQFRTNYVRELAPEGEQELDIVLEIVRLSWRLKNFGIFFDAQKVRKEFAPLIRSTLELTRAAHARFESNFLQALYEEEIPRQQAERRQLEEGLRETCKTIDDKSRRVTFESIIALFDSGKYVSAEDVAEMLLQSALPLEARKLRQNENAKHKVNGSPIDLAYIAHAITPQSCMAELALRETLERALDRALARYWKLKDEKRKAREAREHRSRLPPPPHGDVKPQPLVSWRTLKL